MLNSLENRQENLDNIIKIKIKNFTDGIRISLEKALLPEIKNSLPSLRKYESFLQLKSEYEELRENYEENKGDLANLSKMSLKV